MRRALIVGIAVLLVAACSGDDESDQSTTSTTAATITTLGDPTAVVGTEDGQAGSTSSTTTSTVDLALSFPEYTIVSREASENGDIVVGRPVVLDEEEKRRLAAGAGS